MSINCSNFCLYQIDGNCNLNNKEKRQRKSNNFEHSDCPYFEKTQRFL